MKSKQQRAGTSCRKRHAAELRAERAPSAADVRLRMALDAAGMVTWEWDLRTDLIRYSDNVASVAMGRKISSYATSTGLLKTIHPDDRPAAAVAFESTRLHGSPFECEYRVRMQDGKYHWILGKGRSVIVERGKPVVALGVSQDITARKHAERELQARSRQLAELSSELIMAEYRERRRLADILNENLQQMLVGARIEVEAIAAGLRGRTGIGFRRVQRVLSKVIELARSITLDLAPPVIPQNDSSLAFEWLAHDMRNRHRLSVDVAVQAPLAGVPEPTSILIFTAARELLRNVVKHAGTDRACLRIRLRNGVIELSVSDSGSGFKPVDLLSHDRRPGYGLFSIRERAQLLGGTLAVHSVPGRGTRVILSLPLLPRGQRKEGDVR